MIRPNIGGFSMIEVLVTIVILLIGLLGLAGLQGRAFTTQMESYQRSQALILLQDMADRINANRKNANSYVTASALGTADMQPTDCAGLVGQPLDSCEWSNALKGAAEKNQGAGDNVGAMIGARGCVYQLAASAVGIPGQYLVAVAWQGLNRTAPSAVDCGAGAYGDEALRRVVTLPVGIAVLN